jgi:hypothetical protein
MISITGTITNGIQGSYAHNATINYNGFVYMKSTSNTFYISSPSSATSATAVVSSSTGSVITSTGQAISIQTANYPLNRLSTAIYTFAITNPQVVVSTLQINLPSVITSSKQGVACGYQNYSSTDDYFNL